MPTQDDEQSGEGGTFSVLQGTRDGLPAIVVFDAGLSPDTDKGRFQWLITISIPIEEPNENGLCDSDESEALGELEDALLERVAPSDYRYVARITWNGTREILFYVADPDSVLQLIEGQYENLEEAPDIQIGKDFDPEWEEYSELLSQLT